MNLFEFILNTVSPIECFNCASQGGRGLCQPCISSEVLIPVSSCYKCNASTDNFETCKQCRYKSPIKNLWVAGEYEGILRDAILNMKYKSQKHLTKDLGTLIADALPYFDEDAVIVPVVTATSRQRGRGFDQALLLAEQVSRRKNFKVSRSLKRIGQTVQVGAKRKQRAEYMSDAFRVTSGYSLKGKVIILIDDVITTGATLESAAKVVKKAGAKKVVAVVIARD